MPAQNPSGRPRVVVIGCGAAGMFAAIAAAEQGARVTVLEKNEKAGKKLYITGKGRCNLTNACETPDFFDAVMHGSRFLYSAVYGYDASRVQRFFAERGCPVKTERGMRVFPVSDKSSDVIGTLVYEMRRLGVTVRYDCAVKETVSEPGQPGRHITGVCLSDGEVLPADAVIVATGGLSYPSTGSTGDGYAFARAAGHTVTDCSPSLVPFETREAWHRSLQGLTLKNVRLYGKGFDEQGELLFTHFGVSGPLVLTASAILGDALRESTLSLAIDLKPALTPEELDRRLIRDFEKHAKKRFANSLGDLFPASLVPVMARLAEEGMPADGTGGISREEKIRVLPETKACAVTRAQRRAFGALMKRLPVTVSGTRGFGEAVITRGGVQLKEVNPSTMESRCCKGLFFAGEVLDCDALTGGFNLQIAWSTGYRAGVSAASGKEDRES